MGSAYVGDEKDPYGAFCKNVDALKRLSNLKSSYLELDRYLWLRGQYENSQNGRPVNRELASIFRKPSEADKRDFEQIMNLP